MLRPGYGVLRVLSKQAAEHTRDKCLIGFGTAGPSQIAAGEHGLHVGLFQQAVGDDAAESAHALANRAEELIQLSVLANGFRSLFTAGAVFHLEGLVYPAGD